jgi:hypothetical protein
MSDPFERLRDVAGPHMEPDVGAIRARARAIQRRRYVLLGSSATVIVIVAMIGLVVTRPDHKTQQLAKGTPQAVSGGKTFGRANTTGALSGAASTPTADKAAALAPGSAKGAPGVASSEAMRRSGPAPLEVTLDVTKRTPRGATLTLKACNKGSETIERSFNTSQRYDFEISRNGELVWRWSDGMAFAQVVGDERWKAGECKTWSADWNGTNSMGAPASPGTYQAVGILKSSPVQRTKPKDVCLDLC